LKNKQILSSTYFSRCETKSLKNIAPEPQSIFSENKKNYFLGRSQKSKTPGLSFSSKGKKRSFLSTLSQKKVRILDLDVAKENSKFKKKKKRLSSIHEVSQSEQVILFDALSPDQLLK